MIIDDVRTDDFYFDTDDMCELYGRLKIFIRMIIDDFRTDDLYFHTDDSYVWIIRTISNIYTDDY